MFGNYGQTSSFHRLKQALQKTKQEIARKIARMTAGSDDAIRGGLLDELEAILIGVDLGVETTSQIVESIRKETELGCPLTPEYIQARIREHLLDVLKHTRREEDEAPAAVGLHVVLVVGVNGVGKTTTIAKLAHRFNGQGRSVLVCASDTFRAAAAEQLSIWSERTGVEIVKQIQGADPAAVLFDAISAGKARRKDVLIVDTAGRLHTKRNLMQELDKMRRVAAREVLGAPHEVLLILDATTGQNAVIQAREFLHASGVTGIVVTKLDGTAKGGIVIAIARQFRIPVRYLGTGETLEDLVPFAPEAFVDSLLLPREKD